MNNLYLDYKNFISHKLMKQFNYKNIHQIPKILKITLNMGLGLNAQNKSYLKNAFNELSIITLQKPVIVYTKKSISNFKIRKDMPIGLFVTLRRVKMYNFLEKLIKFVLPSIRDFQGLNLKNFDKNGNYNLGLIDQLIFSEIDYNSIDSKRGLNISITTSTNNNIQSLFLLKNLGLPFKNIE